MPRYQFHTRPAGLTADLFVGVSVPFAAALARAGVPVPKFPMVQALLDTGADHTCVAPWVIAALGLQRPAWTHTTQTVSGSAGVRFFELSVGFPSSVTGGRRRSGADSWT